MTTNDNEQAGKTLLGNLGGWIATLSALVTLLLTGWNAWIKNEIDGRQQQLQQLEVRLKERTTGIEESKEKVERYKWVLSLFPSLTEKDQAKRNFAVALVQLALTKDEAERLFAGLQVSSNPELTQVGQSGVEAIESDRIARLVVQINANSADDRKAAVASLAREYNASTRAISLVLQLYDSERIGSLSPNGAINGLYYLSATDPQAWNQTQVQIARSAIDRISRAGVGPQTRAALDKLNDLLSKTESRP